MLKVEIQSPNEDKGVYEVKGTVAVDGDRIEVWNPEGQLDWLLEMSVPVWTEGERRAKQIYLRDDPETWIRQLNRILHSYNFVPVITVDDADQVITRDEISQWLKLKPNTWSGYVSRNQAPQPVKRVGSTPLWSRREVLDWQESRRGRGHRRVNVN